MYEDCSVSKLDAGGEWVSRSGGLITLFQCRCGTGSWITLLRFRFPFAICSQGFVNTVLNSFHVAREGIWSFL